MPSSKENITLNLVRGVSALLVAIGHLRSLLFVDYQDISPPPGIFLKALYFLSGFGHQAVLTFFVLSGFLICSSVLFSFRNGTWDYRVYLINRLSRLLTVLLPALVLGFTLDAVGMWLSPGGVYAADGRWGNVLSTSVQNVSSLPVYFGNALFLQNVFVPTAGSNVALWSLSNEFSYYLLFMALSIFFFRTSTKKDIALAIIVGSLTLWLYWGQIVSGFAVWMFGALLAGIFFFRSSSIPRHWTKVFGALIALSVVFASRVFPSDTQELLLGLSVTIFLFFGYSWEPKRLQTFSKWLSDRSYTLYATHLPLVVFFSSRVAPEGRLQPTTHLYWFFVGLLGLSFYVELLYFFFERRTPRVKAFFTDRLKAVSLAAPGFLR